MIIDKEQCTFDADNIENEILYSCVCEIDTANNKLKDKGHFDNNGEFMTTVENTQSELQSYTIEELNNQLNAICQSTDTNRSGLDVLISYYQKSLDWTEEASLRYAIELFKNGTIDQIKVFGKDEEVL